MIESQFIFWAVAGGVLPALIWLWFWLREDKENPEPRKMIALAFLLGIAAVPLVLPIQYTIEYIFHLLENTEMLTPAISGLLIVIFAALAEEIFKLLAAWPALKSRFMDEPIDAIIYLIVAALGFAGAENSLYILGTFMDTSLLSEAALVGNLRFIGSTLLHIVSSAAIGVLIAFSFYGNQKQKNNFLFWGVFFATLIHFLYNVLVSRESLVITAFLGVWALVIVLFIVFEKIKFWDKKKKAEEALR